MSAEMSDKLETGIRDCLAICAKTDRPFFNLAAFIESLKANPDWTQDEIITLQTQVIRLLLNLQSPNDGPPEAV